MSWWRKLLRVGVVVVSEVTDNKKVAIGTQVITSALTDKSPEDAAATLLLAVIEKGSEKEEVRAMALRMHDVIQHFYSQDPDFH
jgi:hypothetical protein